MESKGLRGIGVVDGAIAGGNMTPDLVGTSRLFHSLRTCGFVGCLVLDNPLLFPAA